MAHNMRKVPEHISIFFIIAFVCLIFEKQCISKGSCFHDNFSSNVQVKEPAQHLKLQVELLQGATKLMPQLKQLEASPATGCPK